MRYFPLFADLRDRRVLVVGGGVVAERKTRLLLEAGAQVTVVAPEFGASLRMLAAEGRGEGFGLPLTAQTGEGRGEGRVVLREERFRPDHLDGVVLAVAATDDVEVNTGVAAAGRERNVLVNVVDVAELSSFIVPAIVDRSPLVIAISSGGVAPVLARHVRERIEALFVGSVGRLAGLLERWRARIKQQLPDVAARRRFY